MSRRAAVDNRAVVLSIDSSQPPSLQPPLSPAPIVEIESLESECSSLSEATSYGYARERVSQREREKERQRLLLGFGFRARSIVAQCVVSTVSRRRNLNSLRGTRTSTRGTFSRGVSQRRRSVDGSQQLFRASRQRSRVASIDDARPVQCFGGSMVRSTIDSTRMAT